MKSEEPSAPGSQSHIEPSLRFKGTYNHYSEENILSFATMKARIGWQNLRKEEHLDQGDYYLVTGTDFYLNRIDWANAKYVEYDRYIQDEHIILKESDILITKDGTIGKLAYVSEIGSKKSTLNNGVFRIRVSKQHPLYIFYTFQSRAFKKYLHELSGGSSIKHLYQKDFERYNIYIPQSIPEQQKIAGFLSAVDEKIQQLTKKKELLEQYKKGVMQKIFSQQIRFKDEYGNDYPDWEEKRLGQMAKIVGGGTPETGNPEYWNGQIQWFTPTEIRAKYIKTSKRTITQAGLDRSSAKLLPKGTILFTSRATIAELGFATRECTTNQGFQSLIVNQNNFSEFIYYLIKINKKDFIRKSQGSTFLEISSGELRKMIFSVPAYPEQQKIANHLSSIDTKIEIVTQQITQTQTFKKGLLQQMFV